MVRFTRLVAVAMLLTGCQLSPATGATFPPLPGPTPDVEIVAVSPTIATPARPVFYYRDPQNAERLLAYDWTGTLRGSLTVAASEPYGAYPSEDGTVLQLMHAHIVSGGQAIGSGSHGMWAGDNAHICTFLNQLGGPGAPRTRQVSANELEGLNTPGALFYQSAQGQARHILDFGTFTPHGGPTVLACNAKTNRAVVAQSFVAELMPIEVVRLADGHVIGTGPRRPSSGPAGVIVSQDGTLVGLGSSVGYGSGPGASFTVYRLPSNEVVRQIAGGGIDAFSSDDTRLVIAEDVGNSSERQHYQLIDLANGATLWSADMSPGTVWTRPGTGDFLIASRTWEPSKTRPNGNDPFEDVWIVSADGSARLILKHASPIE